MTTTYIAETALRYIQCSSWPYIPFSDRQMLRRGLVGGRRGRSFGVEKKRGRHKAAAARSPVVCAAKSEREGSAKWKVVRRR
jgi:hypothetical protein